MTVSEYYDKLREARAALPEKGDSFFIVSTKSANGAKAGVVVEVARETAAKFIAEETHALATDEQVEAYKAEQRKKRQDIIEEDYSRKQTVNLRLTPGEAPQIDRSPSPRK